MSTKTVYRLLVWRAWTALRQTRDSADDRASTRAPKSAVRGFRTAALLAVCCAAGAAGCEGSQPLIYTAQAYSAEAGCLEGYAPVGLIQGDTLGAECDAVCLALDEQVYVSTVCPPYPTSAELLGPEDSPECQAALQALADESSCDDDPDAGE